MLNKSLVAPVIQCCLLSYPPTNHFLCHPPELGASEHVDEKVGRGIDANSKDGDRNQDLKKFVLIVAEFSLSPRKFVSTITCQLKCRRKMKLSGFTFKRPQNTFLFIFCTTCPIASQMSGTILMLWQSRNTTTIAMRTSAAFFLRLKHDLVEPVMLVGWQNLCFHKIGCLDRNKKNDDITSDFF